MPIMRFFLGGGSSRWRKQKAEDLSATRGEAMIVLEEISPAGDAAVRDSGDNSQKNGEEI